MGKTLFGIDIAVLLNDAIGNDVRQGILTRVTQGERDPENLLAGPAQSSAEYTFNGFKEVKALNNISPLTELDRTVISILGASCAVTPRIGDTISLDGETFRITAQPKEDPAAALFECYCEEL